MFGMEKLVIYAIILSVITASVGGVLYMWHYKPIKNLNVIIITQKEQMNTYKFEIKNLKTKIQNGKELLQKCKDDKEVEVYESEFNTKADRLDDLYKDYLKNETETYTETETETENKEGHNVKTNPNISERFIF